MKNKEPNNELIELYEQKLKVIMLVRLVPILVGILLSYQVVTVFLKTINSFQSKMLFIFLTIMIAMGITFFTVGATIRAVSELIETRKKLKLAREGEL